MSEGRKTFGQELNHLRTERGVTLEELASATKVRTVLLSALEEGRFDELPPAVFVEGYLKACIRFLGADPKPWLERYRNLAGVSSSSDTLPLVFQAPYEEPGVSRWLKWTGGLLLLGSLAFASYVLMKQMVSTSQMTESSAPAPRRAREVPAASARGRLSGQRRCSYSSAIRHRGGPTIDCC
ncbi:MAG: hypothetical protein B7X11_01420 [Acidobacteria bacterium 37-65-4]|nr:MAG: hypothetical protein B7X11_01420 [Acidobacteria bacterium 37-65-4]